MPAFAGIAADIFARDRRVKLDHRFAAFDRRVGTTGNDHAGFQKAVPGVGAVQSLHAEPARREMKIANRVRRLHRGNDAELREARNVSWIDDLRMLDAPTRFRNLAL